MRRGFSIIFALIVMVIVAVLSVLSLSISAQTTEVTTNRYLREQVELLAYSATKLAYMELNQSYSKYIDIDTSNFDNTLQCFDVNVSVANEKNITDRQQVLVLDTFVTSNDKCGIYPKISFHRRTIQEIN